MLGSDHAPSFLFASKKLDALASSTVPPPLALLFFSLSLSASELWIVHPSVMPLPSVAAIFSGPLNRQAQDFATAPLVSRDLIFGAGYCSWLAPRKGKQVL